MSYLPGHRKKPRTNRYAQQRLIDHNAGKFGSAKWSGVVVVGFNVHTRLYDNSCTYTRSGPVLFLFGPESSVCPQVTIKPCSKYFPLSNFGK